MIRQFVNIAVAVMLVGGILFGIGKDSLATSNQKGIKESGRLLLNRLHQRRKQPRSKLDKPFKLCM